MSNARGFALGTGIGMVANEPSPGSSRYMRCVNIPVMSTRPSRSTIRSCGRSIGTGRSYSTRSGSPAGSSPGSITGAVGSAERCRSSHGPRTSGSTQDEMIGNPVPALPVHLDHLPGRRAPGGRVANLAVRAPHPVHGPDVTTRAVENEASLHLTIWKHGKVRRPRGGVARALAVAVGRTRGVAGPRQHRRREDTGQDHACRRGRALACSFVSFRHRTFLSWRVSPAPTTTASVASPGE